MNQHSHTGFIALDFQLGTCSEQAFIRTITFVLRVLQRSELIAALLTRDLFAIL